LTVDDRWKFNDMRVVFLRSDKLSISIIPELGGVIWSIRHLDGYKEILAQTRDPMPLNVIRGLYPVKNLLDIVLVGGWYEVIPNVGYYSAYGGGEYGLHEETVYLPWKVMYDDSVDTDSVTMQVSLVKSPLEITKRIRLKGERMILEERLTNKSEDVLEFAWLHHPTFGGDLLDENTELLLNDCEFEIDKYLPTENASLRPGYRGKWPHGKSKSGQDVDLSKYPRRGEINSDDLIYIPKMPSGEFTIQNKRKGISVEARWDKNIFPTLWIWRAMGGGKGYPWYGNIYATAVEISTSYPATGLADQSRMKTSSSIAGRGSLETVLEFDIKTC
jgi:hypothetical protein